jgi:hypothetical protein
MSTSGNPDDDRIGVQVNVPNLGSVGYQEDNVYNASTPSQLQTKPGDKGTQTEWTIGTFDEAITWLTTHADYLDRLRHGTNQIDDLIKGPSHSRTDTQWMADDDGPVTSLGGFRWARTLAKQHGQLLTETQQQLKNIVDELHSAASALQQVRDKYHNAEHASAMSAAEFESDFNNKG